MEAAQRLGMMNFTELPSVPSDPLVPVTEERDRQPGWQAHEQPPFGAALSSDLLWLAGCWGSQRAEVVHHAK
jgi:hypothetical protein